jgi:hypothetical protein
MCKSHAGTGAPHSASPSRGHPGGFPPHTGTERPLTPSATAPASRAAVELRAARPHPGGGGCKLPRTKELSANDAELRGERGRPAPRAQRPRCCHEPGLKLRRRAGGTLGRSRVRVRRADRARGAQTLPQQPGLLVPLPAR